MRQRPAPQSRADDGGRQHDPPRFDGIVAWTRTLQTERFIEASNGLFQAVRPKARGYTRFKTMRTVILLAAGRLDSTRVNPHAA